MLLKYITSPDLCNQTLRLPSADIRFGIIPEAEADALEIWGQFSPYKHMIRLQESFSDKYKFLEVLLHEITHAIFYAYKIYSEDNEERTCLIMGVAWVQVFRDNPWLVGLIQEITSDAA